MSGPDRPAPCRCNCGYTCGGPGRCALSVSDCLAAGHFVRDCDHRWDGPWRMS